jgi:two-component system chemotaxis response regulator CheB
MGDDGARGIQRVREKGGRTIAEASQTAVVFGMPQAAIRTGAVEAVLPLQEIPERLRREAETPEATPAGGGNSRRGER